MSAGWASGSDYRWRRVRARVLRLDLPEARRPRCAIGTEGVCTDVATCVDHVVPLAMGGAKYDEANLRPACEPCNLARNQQVRAQEAEAMPRPRRVSSW